MNDVVPTRRVPSWLVTALLATLLSGCGGEKPEALVASAKAYLAKNDAKAAIIQLKNALQEDVTLGEARYLLGVALLRTGDAAGAEAELRKARDYKHSEDDVAPALAEAMLVSKQYRKLTDEFAGDKLENRNAQARLQTTVAFAFQAQRRPDAARESLETALRADPSFSRARLAQARDQAAGRDFDAAMTSVATVITAEPNNHEAWKLKGDVLWFGRQQLEEAMAAYRKSTEIRPDYLDGHAAILDRLMSMGKLDDATRQVEQMKKVSPTALATVYYESLLAYARKDLKLAMPLAQQLVQRSPENVRAQHLAGEIALASHAPAQAIGALSEAVRLAPRHLHARRSLVRAYLAVGRPAKALAVLQPMLAGDSVDLQTHLLAGETYLQNGNLKMAQEHFAKAAENDPKSTRARTSLAVARLRSGGDEAALGELRDVAFGDKGVTADLALISALMARRDFDKALKAIDALEKKQPDKPLAPTLRAVALITKKEFADARRSYERAVGIDPAYFPALSGLAALDMLEKKPDDARKRFESVLAQNPNDLQALLALAELRAQAGAPKGEVAELISRAVTANPTERQPRLLLVEFHLRNQDVKLALAAAQSAVTALPDSPDLLDALGRSQQAAGDANQAMATYGKLATMQPESVVPLMRMASAQMESGNQDAAAASLRKALALKPDFLDAQRALIQWAVNAKNFTEALAIARTIARQRPKGPEGFVLQGDVAAVQKNWDAALDAYRQGMKVKASPLLASKVHGALDAAGKAAEAGKFAASWLKDQPKDMGFRLYLGNLAASHGDYAAAEKMYAAVVGVQPDNAAAINNLAWVNGKQGKDGAVALAERAVALEPRVAAYMDTLAMLLSQKNEYARALDWQNKALALEPRTLAYRLNLAKIHLQGGKKDLARKELEALMALGPKFAGQAEVASLLRTM